MPLKTSKYQVKNVKSFQGRQGYGYECSLYRGGKRVAKVVDTASGGEVDFYWEDSKETRVDVTVHGCSDRVCTFKATPEEKILLEHVGPMFYEEPSFDGKPMRLGIDGFLAQLVDKFEEMKQYKAWCRKGTVFRLKGDKEGSWRILRIPYSNPRAKKCLDDKYGKKVEEILNEKVAAYE
jgi:hypothetical protein